ncbi:uncharacterized protein MELLADRAFT_91565 [Melampsora larici-populina 98AG31]|uniref:Uncharacterized protein n=1 Tax=Melampsora larici-populina (strain 98AG31 / pathotype 3-4-7) TaxID=747676 RepID=F4RZI3_MELLP|nr:uncharacterized protein MELLADRAFT_91565 [Melampsora larici-populina 98AG31]EGG02232.1 hypothetical protein MELLADRAFT_91565 [Melampsora larici-populina 98AG31]
MSDEDAVTGHGIYLSANFEIEEKISSDQTKDAAYRTYILSIPCTGANRARSFSYEIRATGFSGKGFKLLAKNIYNLRGGFFPRNRLDTSNDQLFFEALDRGIITHNEGFVHNLSDTVGITGLGRVSKTETILEETIQHLIPKNPGLDKLTTVVTVEHSDYHPEKRAQVCRVEYRIRPFPHLAGSHKTMRVGRECLFHGYIKDFNEVTECYIAIVNKVSATCGNAEPHEMGNGSGMKKSIEGGSSSQVNPNKPVKFNPRAVNSPFKSPLITSDSKSSLPFGPSEFTETSFSSASSRSQASSAQKVFGEPEVEETGEEPVRPKATKGCAPPKSNKSTAPPPSKRPRAPRAIRAKAGRSSGSGAVVDIASDD